jgi:hypothetical protein
VSSDVRIEGSELPSLSTDGFESSANKVTTNAYLHVLTADELRDALFCESIKKAYEEVDGYVRSYDDSGKKILIIKYIRPDLDPSSTTNLTRH